MNDEALRLPIGSPRTLLGFHVLLWLAASFDLFKYVLNRPVYLGDLWPSLCILFLLGWLMLLGLHTARVISAEAREASETEGSMLDDELYEIARNRIDKRNRRWILWGVDFLAFLIYVGLFLALYRTIPHDLGVLIALGWFGVLVLHAISIGMMQNRDQEIESEVAKLRAAVYEKPKRLEMSDDGELIDFTDEAQPSMKGDSE